MKLSDFDFDLPESLIATRPAAAPVLGQVAGCAGRPDRGSPCARSARCFAGGRFVGPEHDQGDPRAADRTAPPRQRARASGRACRDYADRTANPTGRGARWQNPCASWHREKALSLPRGLWRQLQNVAPMMCGCDSIWMARLSMRRWSRPAKCRCRPIIEARRKADEQDRTDYQTVFRA